MAIAADETPEMRDLLIRIDEKVRGVGEKLDRMDRRGDEHERRLMNVETRVHTIEAKSQSNQNWVEWAWKLFGTPATILIGFLILLYAGVEIGEKRDTRSHLQPAASQAGRN